MYFYLFDIFLSQKKHSKIAAKIETRIIDLGISGKIARMSVLKSMSELITGAISQGAKTIVVVGNDKTISQAINVVADKDVTLGFIPVGPHNKLAQMLGIPSGELACDALSSRLIEKIDLGKINNHYFLSSVTASDDEIVLECDENYQIIPSPRSQINICNFGRCSCHPSNPKDGVLETVVSASPSKIHSLFKPNEQKDSLFLNKKVSILSSAKDQKKSVAISVDGIKILKTPAQIEIVPRKLKIIVGKKRMF